MVKQFDRRTVLEMAATSSTLGALSTPVTAISGDAGKSKETPRPSKHPHSPLDERNLGYDVRVTSRDNERRAVSVRLRKVVFTAENPTLYSQTYNLESGGLVKEDISGRIDIPGMLEVVVEVDDGRSQSINWWMPAERIPPHRGIDVVVGNAVIINPHIT